MAYEKNGFTTADAVALANTLATNAGNFATAMNAVATATDGKSAQSWYGLPEAIADDLHQAIDLVALATLKLNS